VYEAFIHLLALKCSQETRNMKIQRMNYPEYHSLFSGAGEFEVSVKFKGDSFMPSRRATAAEIMQLFDVETGAFRTAMTFDEHLYEIYKYNIDPIKNKITLSVRTP
jgi:hypothetical protein